MEAHADERLAGIRHRAAIADEARLRLARFSLMPSTVISTILYRPEARELEVLFTTGRRYVYRDVPAEAAEAFRSAAVLFPNAQSPHLAISRLAADGGDTRAAHERVDRVLRNSNDEAGRFDPWWLYHRCSGRDANVIYEEFSKRGRKLTMAAGVAMRSRR